MRWWSAAEGGPPAHPPSQRRRPLPRPPTRREREGPGSHDALPGCSRRKWHHGQMRCVCEGGRVVYAGESCQVEGLCVMRSRGYRTRNGCRLRCNSEQTGGREAELHVHQAPGRESTTWAGREGSVHLEREGSVHLGREGGVFLYHLGKEEGECSCTPWEGSVRAPPGKGVLVHHLGREGGRGVLMHPLGGTPWLLSSHSCT